MVSYSRFRRWILLSDSIKDVICLIFHLLTALVRLVKPGGGRTVIAENLLLKQQLIIHSRSRQRAPNLTTQNRALLGFLSLFLNPRRLATHYKSDPNSRGPSWLTTIGHAKDSLWSVDLFRCESILLKSHWTLVVMDQYTRRISSANDPLFQYHRWKANLRVLEIEEIKSLPHVPMPHPFVERLIGSVRRELLDQTFFWTETDLQNKLREYQCYYNECRTHSGRQGATPIESAGDRVVDINDYRWKKHCRGLFELPVAA